MRKIIGSSLLILMLACATYAGHIPNGVTDDGHIPNDYTVTPTPTPSTSGVSQDSSTGDAQVQPTAESIAIETALNLLNSVLSLL